MYSIDQADVVIDLASQTLFLPKFNKFYLISSGENGIGEQENSGKTPRGWHQIEKKIGGDMPLNAVFKAREWTNEIYDAELGRSNPERDWILSRILWLKGLELDFNLGEGCDTFKRYIYIHGTPDSEPMGIPKSHGCIRMNSKEVKEVFDLIDEGALVFLSESKINA